MGFTRLKTLSTAEMLTESKNPTKSTHRQKSSASLTSARRCGSWRREGPAPAKDLNRRPFIFFILGKFRIAPSTAVKKGSILFQK